MSKQIKQLLHVEMTRSRFLRTLGLGMVTVLGLSSILGLISGKDAMSHLGQFGTPAHNIDGYGSSAYGG